MAIRDLIGSPRVVSAVSAGAAMACAVFADLGAAVLTDFQRRARDNRRNFYPLHLFGANAVFPHQAMYRNAILDGIDERALTTVQNRVDIRVLISVAPRWANRPISLGLAAMGAAAQMVTRRRLRFGFQPTVVSVRDCENVSALADLILCSSAIPPVIGPQHYENRLAIDGGFIDNTPKWIVPSDESTLVLLTAPQHNDVTLEPKITVAAPSRPIDIAVWDYANPSGLQRAFDLGQRDGEAFANRLRRAADHRLNS